MMKLITALLAAALLLPSLCRAQLWSLTKQEMTEMTVDNPFERFPDGRPKVPDAMIERAKGLSMEEVWAVLQNGLQGRFRNQYEDNFQVLHPGKKMVGRAFTVQFMPARGDLDTYLNNKAKGIRTLNNQYALDMLQPGDVLVVDLFGKKEGGTIVGDNLFYYVMKATKGGGLVVDGAIRDLEGIAEIDMPAYFRSAHPSAISGVVLTGINIPVRVGNVTVMPGDLVVGDREGVYFIPPQFVTQVLDGADRVHIHDSWTRQKFDEDKYKSSDIYSSPHDPALQKEYQEHLNKELEELKKKRQ
jgi:4-hydroxy-4-methyl-2-oxoglutarate aldolase